MWDEHFDTWQIFFDAIFKRIFWKDPRGNHLSIHLLNLWYQYAFIG